MPGPERQGHARHRQGPRLGAAVRQQASSPASPAACPQIETDLVRGTDVILHFRNLRLTAPEDPDRRQRLSAARRHLLLRGQGHAGPIRPVRDDPRRPDRAAEAGDPARRGRTRRSGSPTCCSTSIRPPAGFAYRAEGGSTLGPFTSHGAILLPADQPALIQVAALNVSQHAGHRARCAPIRAASPAGSTSPAAASTGGCCSARSATSSGSRSTSRPTMPASPARRRSSIRSGRLEGVVLLDPGRHLASRHPDRARAQPRRAVDRQPRRAAASCAAAPARSRARIAGTRGRDFVFDTVADIAPGRFRLTGRGTVDRRAIQLTEPALLTREGDGWRLAPTALTFAGGNATVSGLFGGSRTEVNARMNAMPLVGARHRLAAARPRRHRLGHAQLPLPGAAGEPSGDGQSARPRPDPLGPGPLVAAGRYRPGREARRRQCRRCARSRSAKARRSAARRRGWRRSGRAATSATRLARRAAVRAASL